MPEKSTRKEEQRNFPTDADSIDSNGRRRNEKMAPDARTIAEKEEVCWMERGDPFSFSRKIKKGSVCFSPGGCRYSERRFKDGREEEKTPTMLLMLLSILNLFSLVSLSLSLLSRSFSLFTLSFSPPKYPAILHPFFWPEKGEEISDFLSHETFRKIRKASHSYFLFCGVTVYPDDDAQYFLHNANGTR